MKSRSTFSGSSALRGVDLGTGLVSQQFVYPHFPRFAVLLQVEPLGEECAEH
jgi:hypothetical protein